MYKLCINNIWYDIDKYQTLKSKQGHVSIYLIGSFKHTEFLANELFDFVLEGQKIFAGKARVQTSDFGKHVVFDGIFLTIVGMYIENDVILVSAYD